MSVIKFCMQREALKATSYSVLNINFVLFFKSKLTVSNSISNNGSYGLCPLCI
jgi:hypothetical protein